MMASTRGKRGAGFMTRKYSKMRYAARLNERSIQKSMVLTQAFPICLATEVPLLDLQYADAASLLHHRYRDSFLEVQPRAAELEGKGLLSAGVDRVCEKLLVLKQCSLREY